MSGDNLREDLLRRADQQSVDRRRPERAVRGRSRRCTQPLSSQPRRTARRGGSGSTSPPRSGPRISREPRSSGPGVPPGQVLAPPEDSRPHQSGADRAGGRVRDRDLAVRGAQAAARASDYPEVAAQLEDAPAPREPVKALDALGGERECRSCAPPASRVPGAPRSAARGPAARDTRRRAARRDRVFEKRSGAAEPQPAPLRRDPGRRRSTRKCARPGRDVSGLPRRGGPWL